MIDRRYATNKMDVADAITQWRHFQQRKTRGVRGPWRYLVDSGEKWQSSKPDRQPVDRPNVTRSGAPMADGLPTCRTKAANTKST